MASQHQADAIIASGDTCGIDYHPLNIVASDIRLLNIAPLPPGSRTDDTVCCTLEHVPLRSLSPYVALSYCWGDPSDRAQIIVSHRKVSVTVSLETALRRLRRDGHLAVWADAVCINQEDLVERSLQIRQMGAIYRRAKCVISWLGQWESCEKGVACLKDLSNASVTLEDGGIPDDIVQNIDWAAVVSFFQRPYWTRAWIVQEISLAHNLEILCGDATYIALDQVQGGLEACRKILNCSSANALVEASECCHVSRLHKFREQVLDDQPIKLIQVLAEMHQTHTTERHDKVFAFIGLAYDGNALLPSPSYEQSILSINREMTLATMISMKSLDFPVLFARTEPPTLPHVAAITPGDGEPYESGHTVPSWIPNWFQGANWIDERRILYVLRKDRFTEFQGLNWYKSDNTRTIGDTPGLSRPNFRVLENVLWSRGIVIDRIAHVSTTLNEDKQPVFPPPVFSSNVLPPAVATSTVVMDERYKHQWELFRDNPRQMGFNLNSFGLFFLLAGYIQESPILEKHNFKLSDISDVFYAMDSYVNLFVSKTKGAINDRMVNQVRQWLTINGQLPISGKTLANCLLLFPSKDGGNRTRDEAVLAWAYKVLEQGRRLATTCCDSFARNGVEVGFTAGWVAEKTVTGDCLALLAGCSVPVILRRRPVGGYWIVGDAYFPTIKKCRIGIKK